MKTMTTLEIKKAPPKILFRPTSASPNLVKEIMMEKTLGASLLRERE